jgi:diguanylate cyclase (GGDEF)-like protein
MIYPTLNDSPDNIEQHCLMAWLDTAHDAVFLLDGEMKLQLANQTLVGWTSERDFPRGQSILPTLLGLSESIEIFAQQFKITMAGSPARFECLIRPEHCLPRWVEFSLNRVPAPNHQAQIIGIARDITQHKNEVMRLRHHSTRDELTSLLNRRSFTQQLTEVVNTKQGEHALLFIDLDRFKVVNDSCGHHAGDRLLIQVSQAIQSVIPAQDILARIDGDEFAVLLQNCDQQNAMQTATAIRDAVSELCFRCDDKQFEIGTSIGIALISLDQDGTDCSLSAADSACQIAKKRGRNIIQVYVGSTECSQLTRESAWVSRITKAFEDDRFRLFYQNILPIGSEYGCFDHREILIRMVDEDGQHIEPGEFIPSAEKYHLMPLIDRWVVRTMFSNNAESWRKNHEILQTSYERHSPLCCINLSGASLNDELFPDFLRDQIALHQIPPHVVCFEITETVAINNLERVSALIHELKALGFLFALDDFGSGMSSFSYLKSLPVDFLKIDGSLVLGIADNKTDFCMVEAINKIAQEMGIKTIAEFVKNKPIIDKLQDIGVDYAQGFGIHHPEFLY